MTIQSPTLSDWPADMIWTPSDERIWAETALEMRRWIVREARSILDDSGPSTLLAIGGLLVAGG